PAPVVVRPPPPGCDAEPLVGRVRHRVAGQVEGVERDDCRPVGLPGTVSPTRNEMQLAAVGRAPEGRPRRRNGRRAHHPSPPWEARRATLIAQPPPRRSRSTPSRAAPPPPASGPGRCCRIPSGLLWVSSRSSLRPLVVLKDAQTRVALCAAID